MSTPIQEVKPDLKKTLIPKNTFWKILNSWWIVLCFGIGLTSWVSFLYIGYKTNQRKWLLSSLGYFIAMIITFIMLFALDKEKSHIGGLFAVIVTLVSVVHAFIVRKEYLFRLEAIQNLPGGEDAVLKEKIFKEYASKSEGGSHK